MIHARFDFSLKVLRRMEKLKALLPTKVGVAMAVVGSESLTQLQEQTAHRFQEVPSYLWESMRGFPGRRRYPPGTQATFARKSPTLAGTAWQNQVQQYIEGGGALRAMLTHKTTLDAEGVLMEVGYPVGVGTGSTKFVAWVLFGTRKMQPRPFLQMMHTTSVPAASEAVTKGVRQALQEAFPDAG